jgi:broad specificity phosphatase PhoE
MKSGVWLCVLLSLAAATVFAQDSSGLANATVLVIRHAEKPASGDTLTPAGEARAKAYVSYFQNYTIDAKPIAVDYLIAAADSKGSKRPRLTLTPLSQATGLAIHQPFTDKQFQELASDLRAKPHGEHVIICWHHGEIPGLLHALGAKPEEVLPKGKWPEEVFSWVIQLRYDGKGQLMDAKRIKENLMPSDAGMQDDEVPVP